MSIEENRPDMGLYRTSLSTTVRVAIQVVFLGQQLIERTVDLHMVCSQN